ncbi:MAG: rhomboid family intramembrane serine protease [Myxococcota bacterium]
MPGRRYTYSMGGGYPGVTPIVKRLLIANALVFFAQMWMPGLTQIGAISNARVFEGYLWQPFTYMWLHASLMHLVFNMFALWMFGGPLEQLWGSRRFLRFYLVCGVGAGLVILVWNVLTSQTTIPTLGASGAVYGVLTAFSLSWPNRTIMLLFPPIPMKAIWFIPFLFFMQVMFGGGNVSHAGHLGGVLVAAYLLRRELRHTLGGGWGLRSLRYRWHRYRMRGKLRAVRREEWERRRQNKDDDDRPTYH